MTHSALEDEIMENAYTDSGYAIAYGLLQVAQRLKELGFNDAATPMGAIEGHTVMMKEGLDGIASALSEVAGGLY